MDKDDFAVRALALERSLYCIARSYLAAEADCEDALQNALLRAWEKRDTLRQEAYFNTWLTRILINCCKQILRRQKQEMPSESLPEQAAPTDGDIDAWRELCSLDEKYRIVLMLRYRDGYCVADISRILRIPQGTVKARLSRGREQLRTRLIQEEVIS